MTVSERRAALNRTDLGNAERLVARHGDDLRYIHLWQKWLVWDDRRWAIDDVAEVDRRAKEAVRSIYNEAYALDDDDSRKSMVRHALASESASRVRAMIDRARVEEGIAVRHTDLDPDPWLLTVENGTLELKSAELRAHRRADLVTKLAPVAYDANATCPEWLAFLERIMAGKAELIQFLQRAVGYSLTGDTGEQCLFFLYGLGSNGKSTFLEVLRSALGDYATHADFTTFVERNSDGPRNDIARLTGARMVTAIEASEGKRFNESLLKSLTGGDMITARFLRAEFFEFQPKFKIWLAANHKPVIRGTDEAIWRRIRLIPFTVRIPEHERDPKLKERLLAELPGILAWAVEGCQLWLEQGLRPPDEVRTATEQYRIESDELGEFLDTYTEIAADVAVKGSVLYEAYERWAGKRALTQTAFGRKLTERGFLPEKRGRDKDRSVFRLGLRLLPSELTPSGTVGDSRGHDSGMTPIYPYPRGEYPKSVPTVPNPPPNGAGALESEQLEIDE